MGDLPLHAQVKLLRVLEEKKLSRLGSSQPRAVDFRLVAATNRDLKSMIAAGAFREDLYYRINPMILHLPPLNERVEDIPLLVRDMLNRLGGEGVECTDSALDVLMRYGWPGNIRELRNVITRALSLCQNGRITVADLPPELRHQAVAADSGGTGSRLQSVVHTSEAQTILTALHEQKWNVARTARTLGVSRATLYEKMRKFGIRRSRDF